MLGMQVVTDLDGNFIVQIGSSGEEGLRDGSFDEATFNRPQVRNASLLFNIELPSLYSASMYSSYTLLLCAF